MGYNSVTDISPTLPV